MNKFLSTIALVFAFALAQSQNDMKARIEFEAAEKAFELGDYETALKHVNETEKLVGKWTSVPSFLKIEALHAITDMGYFANPNMQPLYEEVHKYMAYMNTLDSKDVPMEKYKKVYEIEKVLNVNKFDERQSPEFIKARDEKDNSISIMLFKPLAQNGNSWAMRNIGLSYENMKDTVPAIEWYKKAVEQGNSQAAMDLAKIDKENGRKWNERAGQMGNPYGIFAHGWYAENTDENPAKALEYYQRAAALGSGHGNMGMAGLYKSGKGVPQDYVKAYQYYQNAAMKGHSSPLTDIGKLYHNGGNGMEQDHQTAIQWYLKAVEKKDTDAMLQTGWIYQNGGTNIAKDYSKAEYWYNNMIEEGNYKAYTYLGALYNLSDNYQPLKAFENYNKAAEAGYLKGMLEAANFYFSGQGGVEKDYVKAAHYYEQYYEGEQKIEPYLDNLIQIYNRGGYGVEKNKEKAKHWRTIRWQ